MKLTFRVCGCPVTTTSRGWQLTNILLVGLEAAEVCDRG